MADNWRVVIYEDAGAGELWRGLLPTIPRENEVVTWIERRFGREGPRVWGHVSRVEYDLDERTATIHVGRRK